MDLLTGFWENLGNKYTSALIAFLTGFVIGQASFVSNFSVVMGLFVGGVFMIVSLLFSTFLETFLADSLTITINLKSIFTIVLLVLFFYVVISAPSLNKFLYNVRNEFRQ